jgi:nitronate monooxygenase
LRLLEEIGPLGKPLVCAGGIGNAAQFAEVLAMGYSGAQLGTRFIATTQCSAGDDYKQAIIAAQASDIVLTERISGVPVSIIRTPYVERTGTRAGPVARWLLRRRHGKRWIRTLYSLQSIRNLKRAARQGMQYRDIYQAGMSVAGIDSIRPAADIVAEFATAVEGLK